MFSQAVSLDIVIAIQVGLALLAGGIWLLERKRHTKRLTELKKQQEVTHATLGRFMEECEKTLLEFSRIIALQRSRQAELASYDDAASGRDGNGALPASSLNSHSTHGAGGKRMAANKKSQVLHLAQQGLAAGEIAGRLDVPRGEIDLILNLKGDAVMNGAPN